MAGEPLARAVPVVDSKATSEVNPAAVAPLQRWQPLGPAAAQLAAWLLLGLVNQALIALLMPASRVREQAAHHFYDLAHFAVLGVVSALAVRAVQELVKRSTSPRKWLIQASFLYVSAFVVSFCFIPEDLQGFVERHAQNPLLTRTLASALLAAMVTSALVLARLPFGRTSLALFAAGLALGIGNGLILALDYTTLHFFAAWLAALAIAIPLAKLNVPVGSRALRYAILAGLSLLAVSGVVFRPGQAVLRRLLSVPSSVLAPMLTQLFPERMSGSVPRRILTSPWFQDRSKLSPIPPSRLLPEPKIVLFLTIDALRADLLAGGKHENQLPALHALKREGVYFSNARAPTPSTLTTVTTLFTGKYYSQLFWNAQLGGHINAVEDPSPRFPELLSAGGIRTVHVLALHGLDAARGAGRGFKENLRTKKDYGRAAHATDLITDRLGRWQGERLFLYLHYIDSHAPYTLAGKHGTLFERYLREIALVDDQLGRLRQFLLERRLWDKTTLIVSADHGEAFGEHNTKYHARTVYEEVLRVPLIIRMPGLKSRQIAAPVSLVDLGPTILDLYGQPTPAGFMGQTLVPLLAGKSVELSRPLVADAGRRIQALILPNGKKVIFDLRRRTTEVYDLGADPGEIDNLADDPSHEVTSAIATAGYFFDVHTLKRAGWEPPWRKF
jgi:arylsulfatase A-like enzyme